MSAKSREREYQREQQRLEQAYGPFPDPGETPPPLEEQDPELARLLGWFCKESLMINIHLKCHKIIVTDGEHSIKYRFEEPAKLDPLALLMAQVEILAMGAKR